VPKRIAGENSNTRANLAVGIIDELRNIRRFLLQPTTHPDWRDLVRDMPADLRALLDMVDRADQARLAASERRYKAEDGAHQIEVPTKKAKHQGARTDALNQLSERSDHASKELAEAQKAVDAAVRNWREAGRAMSDGENFRRMADYEQGKKNKWLLAHCEVLRRLREDLDGAFGGHRHRLDGLPDRLGLRHSDHIKANSATEVLLRTADAVVAAPTEVDLSLDLDQLQLDVVHELGTVSVAEQKRRSPAVVQAAPAPRAQKPERDTVDLTAKKVLTLALEVAREGGQSIALSREDVARAVSRQLDYRISVPSLFGTEDSRRGRRPRHPEFMELWQRLSALRKLAREDRRSRSRGVAESATDEEGS
jgi:hypothetical protein